MRPTRCAGSRHGYPSLTKLSTDLLDLSRVDAGQLRVESVPVDLGEVARALVQELEHVAASSDHGLEADVDGEAWALGDEERVLQIGRALVMNALVHTPSGTPIVVRATRRAGRASLEVEDAGPGIPRDQQEAIFERFYRGEGGVAWGSGLGLAIAKELARLMNGAVTVESRPGRTVFALVLKPEVTPLAASTGDRAFSRENVSRSGR